MIIHVNTSNSSMPKTYLVPFELETDMMSLKTLGSMAKITDLSIDLTREIEGLKGSVRFSSTTMAWVPFYTDTTWQVIYNLNGSEVKVDGNDDAS